METDIIEINDKELKDSSNAEDFFVDPAVSDEDLALIEKFQDYDSEVYALTTLDNPFNPFDDFVSWFMFDIEKGYNTCQRLDRFLDLSDDMTEKEINAKTEQAINEIIKYDLLGIYIKIKKGDKVEPIKIYE